MGVGLGLVVLLGCWIRFARWQAILEVTRRYVWALQDLSQNHRKHLPSVCLD